jgi:pimeloyl-ACP methyl ester carboxylesterase
MSTPQKTVFAIHGAGMRASAWEALAADLPLRALSLPQPPLPDIAGMAAWVEAQLADLPPRSAVLIGHSMGALVALEAAQHPALAGLALIGAAAHMPVNPDLLKQAADAPESAAALILKWGVAPAHATAAQGLKAGMNPAALASDLAACNAYTRGEEAAKAVGVPALVIAGAEDKMVKPSASRGLAALIPGARFHELPACGHMPMVEAPAATAREIKAFAAGLRG